MKEYWLLLESYVFLWSNHQEVLLYNTLSGKGFVYKNTDALKPIIVHLQNESNLYCTTITEIELDNSEIASFVEDIRINFCGNIFDKSIFPNKPLVIIPKLTVNENTFRGSDVTKKDELWGVHAVKNLLEISIQLTGNCILECDYCKQGYKQIPWCYKNENILPLKSLINLLEQTKHIPIFEMNFFGGNVFSYPYWYELITELKKHSFRKKFYINSVLLPNDMKKLNIFKNKNNFIYILIDFCCDKNYIPNKNLSKNTVHIFRIVSFEEYEKSITI